MTPLPSPLLTDRNRAPAPRLSSDHLRLAQSTPQSTVTSLSSQLLSPPISNPPTGSPPPRSEAEDYIGARAKRSKVKHQKRSSYLLATKKTPSDDGLPSKRLPFSGSASSAILESAAPDRPSAKGKETYVPESRKSTVHIATNAHGSVQPPTLLRINTLISTEIDTRSENESHSPASESLRRLSLSKANQEKTTLRRLSENLATSLDKVRQQLPQSIAQTSGLTSSQSHSTAEPGSTCQTIAEPRKFSIRHRAILESPASITLRKASEASGFPRRLSTPTSSELNGAGLIAEPRTPFSELISFRTTILTPAAESPSDIHTKDNRTRSSTLTFSSSSGTGTPKALINFDETSSRKSSPTAGNALTFTDTHVAPGTFVTDPDSRQASIISSSPSRRLSLVQIKSRDSVHEVIWSEGESRSDSGSSPLRPTTTTRGVAESFDHAGHSHAVLEGGSRDYVDPLTIRRMKTLSSLDQALLQWVWHERPQDSESEQAVDARSTDSTGFRLEENSIVAAHRPPARKTLSCSTLSRNIEDSRQAQSEGAAKTDEGHS